MIYFDNNATTRVFDEVAAAMRPYLVEHFANPASAIGEFDGVGRAIASAKATIAKLLQASDGSSVVVTSGATEANNLAIFGAARACSTRRHLVVSAIEHPSVLETARHLESSGYSVTFLPVSRSGVVSPGSVADALTPDTLLVSVMLANNETGVIQPVSEIADLVKARDPRILFHTDATQAVAKVPIDLTDSLASVDLLSLSAHKFHGPKGVGALWVRARETIAPLFFGGGQQGGMRPGTENPATLVGMSAALATVVSLKSSLREIRELRDDIQRRILAIYPSAFALGATVPRLPNTLSVCLPGTSGEDLVDRMAAEGIAISTGSACAHGARKPSHVALAMGMSHSQADCCIRLSLSVETTQREADALLDAITNLVPLKVTT